MWGVAATPRAEKELLIKFLPFPEPCTPALSPELAREAWLWINYCMTEKLLEY